MSAALNLHWLMDKLGRHVIQITIQLQQIYLHSIQMLLATTGAVMMTSTIVFNSVNLKKSMVILIILLAVK